MSDVKAIMFFNVLLRLGFCVCVTLSAIYFNDPELLWWYVLSLCMGFNYKNTGDE